MMNFDPNAIDFGSIFKEAFKVEGGESDYSRQKRVETFKHEMKVIAEERRILNGLAKARERTRKEKLDEPFELGGAL